MTVETHKKDFCDMSQPFGVPFDQWQIINAMLPTKYSAEMKKVATIYEQRAHSCARQLFKTASDMVMDYDQLLNKLPNKKDAVFAWHQDMAYWPKTPDTRTATFSLAVDATTVQNGALKFVQGSGRDAQVRPHVPIGQTRDDAHAVAIAVDETKEPIETLCVGRGDVTVHDEYVIHGSGGNLSQGPRRTFVMAFRTKETVQLERRCGFTHSHNDEVNWDSFDRVQAATGAFKK